ncbi:MAG: hypothetical protein Q7P63_05510 [Verrucomicrobiota bacterium JB022]|nr:hypothetical protein [Verrucomicrobiota bacterium JB022]
MAPHVWSQDSTANQADEDQIFELSPFEVSSGADDIGYYASSTLAGSRLNTNLSDLAAPITVVTKQQLEDTGATSFNEVFLYEANTEGALNYTPIEVNRGGLKDNVGGSATDGGVAASAVTANRVRGLAAPDFGWNYYPSLKRLPADSYNVRSIEINRGPNSILFGLGSPAGIVNQSVGYAATGVDETEITFRYGTNGGRISASTNQSMLDDTLAIFVAGVTENREFSRKPSYDDTDRATIGLTYKPFKGTTIKAFYEHYHNERKLPNSILPIDGITPWINEGRPVWNPVTRQVTYLDSGVTDPFVYSTNASVGSLSGDRLLDNQDSPHYVNSLRWLNNSRPYLRVSSDGSYDFVQLQPRTNFPSPYLDANGNEINQSQWLDADPARRAMYDRRMTFSSPGAAPSNFYSNYTAPSLTNKDIYDWTEVNIISANFGEFDGETYNIELEQRILDNLYFSAGWFRQEYDSFEYYPLGQQWPVTVGIDTNVTDLDGNPNPHYLQPFVDDYQQDAVTAPQENDVGRAMFAYNLDFTDKDGWMRWLGKHQFMALGQYQVEHEYYNRFRMAYVEPSESLWVPDTKGENFAYARNTANVRRIFYLGDAQQRVTGGSSDSWGVPGFTTSGPLTTGVRTYNWVTGQFQNDEVSLDSVHHEWGVSHQKRELESWAGVWQGYLLKDRLVTTVGMRRDKWSAYANSLAGLSRSELYPESNDYRLANIDYLYDRNLEESKQTLEETTATAGFVAKPLSWLSLHYNQSENFNPPGGVAYDMFGGLLPKPEGEGKDWGIAVNLFENKLIAKLNFFETESINERSSQAGTLINRVQRIDSGNLRGWAETVVRLRAGEDPTNVGTEPENWFQTPLTDAQEAEVEALTGLPYDWPEMTLASTQTAKAEGAEFELIYNPLRNWNIKLVIAKQDVSYQSVFPEYEPWIAERMQVWTNATAPDFPGEIPAGEDGSNTIRVDNFWQGWGFGSVPQHPNNNDWSQNSQTYFDSTVTSAVAEARQLEGAAPYGMRKWRGNIITNYRFIEGPLEGFSIGGAIRMEDKAIIGYYGLMTDVDPSTNETLDEAKYYATDPSRPIYDTDVGADWWSDLTHIDLWFKYEFKIFDDKVDASIQLNIRDLFADEGDLLPVYALWDGSVANYRIKEPRQVFVSTTLRF